MSGLYPISPFYEMGMKKVGIRTIFRQTLTEFFAELAVRASDDRATLLLTNPQLKSDVNVRIVSDIR